jgi:tryptophan-rich sensory protein
MPTERSIGTQILALVVFLVVVYGSSAIGGWLTSQGMATGWYEQLRKPAFNPPSWVFGPVWGVLYTTLAVSAWGVWREVGLRGGAVALGAWLVLLALLVLWSGLFFYAQRPGWAFAEIVLVLLVSVAVAILFGRIRLWTGLLLIPYIGWASFATLLNGALWRLNA